MRRIIIEGLAVIILGAIAGIADSSFRPVVLSLQAARAAASKSADPGKAANGSDIDLAEAKKLHEDRGIMFLDARDQTDFVKGHIPGALNLPLDAFSSGAIPQVLSMVSRDGLVVIYCQSEQCDAAELVAIRVMELGYSQIRVFKAGFDAWKAAGQPTQAGG